MLEPSVDLIRRFRLRAHHLDAVYPPADFEKLTGACGMQNSPPGAWEAALYNRAPACRLADMERWLYEEKRLLQAWSLRGAPVVFPTEQSAVFLSALRAEGDEPWIYTKGIGLALDFLQMDFADVFERLRQVMPRLDNTRLVSKTTLDQTLAAWMLPLLPADKRPAWNQPSMYGAPDKQTVGGAAVSFLLRPCAFSGLVVFDEREGVHPTFTSYKAWTGHALTPDSEAGRALVRKFLHSYGPSTADAFSSWLGCSGTQGRRLWQMAAEEMEPATVMGKPAWILTADRKRFLSPPPLQREWLLLGGHDPYLDQRDRLVVQPEKTLHKQIWKTVANPGAVVYRGEIVGVWTSRTKNGSMDIRMTLWKGHDGRAPLTRLAEGYASFRRQKLASIVIME